MNERSEREALGGGQLEGHRQALLNTVNQLLAAHDTSTLALILNSQRPADLFRHLDEEEWRKVLDVIVAPLAAEMLVEMDRPTMLDVAEELDDKEISELVEEMG